MTVTVSGDLFRGGWLRLRLCGLLKRRDGRLFLRERSWSAIPTVEPCERGVVPGDRILTVHDALLFLPARAKPAVTSEDCWRYSQI